MGARNKVKETYSKAKPAPANEEDKRRRYKERKVVPKFNKLFVHKTGNQENNKSLDDFDTLQVKKKPYNVLEKSAKKPKCKRLRKPLTPSSLFTNSTHGSVGHSSANDTFDKLVGGRSRVPPPSSCSKNAEFLSTSCSSYDNSGILYLSLLSRTHSRFHPSDKNVPKVRLGKKDNEKSSKLCEKFNLISEHDLPESCERVVDGKFACPSSPQLFSSYNESENIQPNVYERGKRKSRKATKAKGTLRSRPKNETGAQKHLTVKDKSESSGESDRKSDSLKRCGTPESGSPKCIKKPLNVAVPSSPFVEDVVLVSKNPPTSLESFNKSFGKPIVANFAKVFSEKRHALSQERSASSSTSQSLHGSGKCSIKSDVLTSTPADTSRLRSVPNSISPWNLKFDSMLDHAISPFPQSARNVANISSPSVFQSPMSFKYNFAACSDKKSSSNPSHGSHYHTCFMDGTRENDKVKSTVSSSETNNNRQGSLDSRSKTSPKFYNSSLKLKCGFKGVAIPSLDPTRELTIASPEQLSQSYSRQLDVEEPPVKNYVPDSPMNFLKGNVCETKQPCANQISSQNSFKLQDISKNISSKKLKEINSFLNRPSFVIPRRPRRMKTKTSKNWTEPSPPPRRLTRRATRLMKLEKSEDSPKNLTSSSLEDNTQTDTSSVVEPSIIFLRRKMVKEWELSTSVENLSIFSGVVPRDFSGFSVTTNDDLSVVLPRRISLRLAMKRQTFGKDSMLNYSSLSDVKSSSQTLIKGGIVSTRPAAKRWQNKKKKASFLQGDSLRFSSVSSIETSKSVITSCDFESKRELCSHSKQITECEDCNAFIAEVSLENNSVNNENLEMQEFKNEDDNPAEAIECSVLETTKTTFGPSEETDVSIIDTSIGDVFKLSFCTAVPAKRGKGWIRSLSMARASLLGEEGVEQMSEFTRRQTVHRISMSAGVRRLSQHRILPLPDMTDKILKELVETDEEGENILSQSILSDARRHVLSLCSQTEPLPMTECFTQSLLSCCRKIGEGVYGEVFMTKSNPNNLDGARVLKIMPIEGDFDVNGEPQKKFEEILSEIIISMELSNLRNSSMSGNQTDNFVHLMKCWCVEGSYPSDLLHLWDLYHEEKGSENDRPDVFPDSQLSIVLEFTHGGGDLEGFVFNNAGQSLAVFLQIAYSLAVAEQELEFEHRDLHWGNVLVATTRDIYVNFKISEGSYKLQTQGVKATVIDFTLSRLKAPHCVVYNNLAEDPSLFTAQGDYQFEIYREMKKANRNDWQKFTPYTNVLWLHYILDKMISECYYKNIKTKVHKSNLNQLKELKETILQSESALAFVLRREHNLNY